MEDFIQTNYYRIKICRRKCICNSCRVEVQKGDNMLDSDNGRYFGKKTYTHYCIFCGKSILLKDIDEIKNLVRVIDKNEMHKM